MGDLVRLALEGDGIAVLTLDREERLNALVPELHLELQRLHGDLEDDEHVKAVVLTGSGRAFCAGGDLKEMVARKKRHLMDQDERESARSAERRRLQQAHETIRMLASSRLPLVAAINGPAAGAGLALALTADVRVAVPSATLSVAFPRIGLSGDSGISVLLPSAIGVARARVALLEGAEWSAEEASEIGLVHEIVGRHSLLSHAVARARRLGAGLGDAVGLIRSRLLVPEDLDAALEREIEATLICQETPVHYEAVEAFLAGRPQPSTI